MKVLHIISSLASGGAEVYVRDLSMQMVRSGHEVYIAYISDTASLGRSPTFQKEYQDALTHAGVRYVELGHGCRKAPWRGGASLRRVALEFQPDVIHSHLYYGIFFKTFGFLNVPLVYTHHSSRLGKGKYLYRVLDKLVDRFVGISRDCAEILKGAGASNVTVIYNGVDSDRLFLKTCWKAGREIRLVAVGTLRTPKNFSNLIEAIGLLCGQSHSFANRFSLQIAGEGPLKHELLRQIEREGLSEKVFLLGNREDIPDLLNKSDVFVLSSDWEGLPISLLEAMMTGLPVIVTDVGGCRDVVELCNAGVVVPPGSAEALAQALEQMIIDSKGRQEYGRNAKIGSQQFDISRAVEAHIALYKTL